MNQQDINQFILIISKQQSVLVRMRLYQQIVILSMVSAVLSTKLCLQTITSDPQSVQESTQIPQQYNHGLSCELVFFNVHQNHFYVNITQVPKQVAQLTLTAYTQEQDFTNFIRYQNTTDVINQTAIFDVDLEKMKRNQSYEIVMWFILVDEPKQGETVIVNQTRKAYLLFCENNQQNYTVRLPNKTIALTQAIGLAFMLILPWNIQYRKFLPFTYNILSCFLYICVLVVALYLQLIFGNNNIVYQAQRYFIGVFSLACLVLYSQDLLMMIFCERNKVAFVIGILFSVTVIYLDYFLDQLKDAFFLNNIIAIMVAGAFIKFVIIRKMKSAIWALALMWVFCLFRQFGKQIGLIKFDQGLGIRIIPLFLQLPMILDPGASIICSAFGSSKIIAFGVILNYCKRVDLYLSTHFYRILASILAVICVSAELLVNLFLTDLPTIQVTSILLYYPLATFLMLFFANKRGEWAQIWHGSFYDIAVNRASIPRSVSFEGLQSDFGKDLMINSQLSSDTMKKRGSNPQN